MREADILPSKEGLLSKLRDSQLLSSPTTTLSIGMESLDSGSVDSGGSSMMKKTVSWSHLEDGAVPAATAPLDIVGPKRKRGMLNRQEFRHSSLDESSIVLALGSSPSSSGCKPCTALGLGQADSAGSGSSLLLNNNNYNSPSARSAESDFQLELGNRFSRGFGLDVPLTLGLSTSPVEGSSNMRERSPNSSSEVPFAIGSHGSENMVQRLSQVVDEGSSSARWLKSGGVMPALLQGQHQHQHQVLHLETCSDTEDYQSDDMEESAMMTSTASGRTDKSLKVCKYSGCGKGARGASGLCIAHGGGRRCQKHGCNKGAEGRTAYCKAHGGGRRCLFLGCTKSAEGKTDYCISHGGGRRCSQENCGKAARGRSGLCIRHGGGKRCQREGCSKSAEGYTGLCISHGGGRRCQAPACTKGAQGSTMFCKAHGGGKRCMVEGCGKGAEGSTPLCKGHGGGKRCMHDGGGSCPKSVHGGTMFCVAHGGGKRCGIQGCSKSARGRTAYCVKHGGGKRCQKEGCGKSAQGSTDFCKAHGGGKRCIWGQEGSPYGSKQEEGSSRGTCDRFARGKLGLCAAHSSMIAQDDRVKNGALLSPTVLSSSIMTCSSPGSGGGSGEAESRITRFIEQQRWASDSPCAAQQQQQQQQTWPAFSSGFSLIPPHVLQFASPAGGAAAAAAAASVDSSIETEGRVHGGGLLALLNASARSSA